MLPTKSEGLEAMFSDLAANAEVAFICRLATEERRWEADRRLMVGVDWSVDG